MLTRRSRRRGRNSREHRNLGFEALEGRELLSAGTLVAQPLLVTTTDGPAQAAAVASAGSGNSGGATGAGGADGTNGAVLSGSSGISASAKAKRYTRSDGAIYVLRPNHDLILLNPAGKRLANFGVVKAFALRSDANGYIWLQSGALIVNTPTGNQRLGMAKGFAVGSDGNGFVWLKSGLLFLNTPTGNGKIGRASRFSFNHRTGQVSAALILRPVRLPADVAGQSYSASLPTPSPSGQYAFTLASGRLPPGLSLDSSGTVSGTTTRAGLFRFAVRVADLQFPGVRGIQRVTLTVNPGPLSTLRLIASRTSVEVGDGVIFTIRASDAFGNPWSGRVFLTSSDPRVLFVPSFVRVRRGFARFIAFGLRVGSAQVQVSAQGVSKSVRISVRPRPVFTTTGFTTTGFTTTGFTSGGFSSSALPAAHHARGGNGQGGGLFSRAGSLSRSGGTSSGKTAHDNQQSAAGSQQSAVSRQPIATNDHNMAAMKHGKGGHQVKAKG